MENGHDERDALIDRYLNNALSEADRTAFEIRIMEEPELLERIQLVEALKQGLVSNKANLAQPSTVVALPFTAWLRQPLSLAASILVAALGLQIVISTLASAPSDGQNTIVPVGSLVLLEATRGNTPAVFTGPGPYLFQLDVGLGTQAENFTVTLRSTDSTGSNAIVAEATGLKADADGWVRVLVNEVLAGEYRAELSWTDNQQNPQSRTFMLVIGD